VYNQSDKALKKYQRSLTRICTVLQFMTPTNQQIPTSLVQRQHHKGPQHMFTCASNVPVTEKEAKEPHDSILPHAVAMCANESNRRVFALHNRRRDGQPGQTDVEYTGAAYVINEVEAV
jgi:hypothetical protein